MNFYPAKNMIQQIFTNKFAEPTIVEDKKENIPSEIVLYQNYPNPFNSQTTFRFSIPKCIGVEFSIFNITGEKIRTLISGTAESGLHLLDWNGRNEKGIHVVSGLYFYKLKSGDFIQSRKMLLLK